MLSLSSPLWLLAMSALPLVWWLHRFHEPHRARQVAALFLWPVHDAPGKQLHRSQRTDPVWLLRALTTGLMVLALCGPRCSSRDAGPVHIWVDDSASMFTLEQGKSRMAQALGELEQQLAESQFSSVTAYSLAAPGQSLALNPLAATSPAQVLGAWTDQPRGEPAPPAPALMNSQATHWLVSDAASDPIVRWAQTAPIARHFGAGSATQNVGITGLSLRRSGSGAARLLVTVANGGGETALRDLAISADGLRLSQLPLQVSAGGEVHKVIDIPGAASDAVLRAVISPGDALPLDDLLELSMTELRPVTVALSDNCGSHLRAALAAHPALASGSITSQPASLSVYCGDDYTGQPGPALRTANPGSTGPVAGPLAWLPGAGPLHELPLNPDWLAASGQETVTDAARVLLRSADRHLVLFDTKRKIIDIRLDLGAPELVKRPEYPLLISGLVDLLLADTPVPATLVRAANPAPVSITPRPLALATSVSDATASPLVRDLGDAFILAALLTLLLDPTLLGGHLARWFSRPGATAQSA